MYSAIAVANAFICLAKQENKTLTNMKLQKLVYIAQGFSLAMLGKPLIFNNVHAFQWGPVIPSLYESVKQYGSNPIPDLIPTFFGDEEIDIDDKKSVEVAIIRGVWEKYGKLSAARLSNITHQQNTPWSEVWEESQYGVIPTDLIQSHYLGILDKV